MKRYMFVLALASCASASIIQTGPINVTGTGMAYWDSANREYRLSLHFQGANEAGDSIAIGGDSNDGRFALDGGAPLSGTVGLNMTNDYTGTIDGIFGLATFSDLGMATGLVQIHKMDAVNFYGPLLAEAQVSTKLVMTGKANNFPNTVYGAWETFDLQAPAAQHIANPEPNTISLAILGLLIVGLRWRR